jgi:hypothetical protein
LPARAAYPYMRPSRAYIAGLGTTGVLVAFALLMLAVVSAILAFRGWPGEGVVDGAEAVTVDSGGRLIDIDPVRLAGASARGTAAGVSRARGTRAAADGAEFNGVRGVSGGGTAQTVDGVGRAGSPALPPAPSLPASSGGGAITGGLADSAEGATRTAAEAVGPAGDGLSQAGQGLSDALRGAEGIQQKQGDLPRLH